MRDVQHLISTSPPVLARLLTVTARAWGLSDRAPVQRLRQQRSTPCPTPPAHALRWAV